MRIYTLAVYLFLYIPIGIIVLFSFNAGRHASDFHGFSIKWYGKVLANPFAMDALTTSLIVASTTAILASIFGTMAALALQKVKGPIRALYDAILYIAIMAHTMFTMALVIVIVRARIRGMDRALIEASADLYATPWRTFLQVTLPQILPAILAGFLLSFTFSFDDFIIAFFVAGTETTLPLYVFSSIRRGVTPEINAIGTMVLAVSLTLLVVVQFLLRGRSR